MKLFFQRKIFRVVAAIAALMLCASSARAQVTLLLEEPYGEFGAMNPTGHAAVYFSRVCAVTPTELRRCRANELGVVISRYHKVDGYDWLAVPLLPYLYAVDNFDEVPNDATPATAAKLRDAWRRANLQAIAPDTAEGGTPVGEWVQLVGEAYDRKMYGYRVETSEAQDDAFIAAWNNRGNKSHFNLLFHNCADYVRVVMDFYFPHAVHRNLVADAGMMTPKQAARCMVRYGRKHPEAGLQIFEIPQVPGSIARSKRVDGAAEALLKSKKYIIPLALLHPYFAGSVAVAYVAEGRFSPPKEAPMMGELMPLENSQDRQVLVRRSAGQE